MNTGPTTARKRRVRQCLRARLQHHHEQLEGPLGALAHDLRRLALAEPFFDARSEIAVSWLGHRGISDVVHTMNELVARLSDPAEST
ncbi:MAG: hypothetical protein GY842_13835 [bacterium]|nr:hypothetical protein [bacterium]